METHTMRYAGKRGIIAMCGAVIKADQWVGERVRPSCKKCRKTTNNS